MHHSTWFALAEADHHVYGQVGRTQNSWGGGTQQPRKLDPQLAVQESRRRIRGRGALAPNHLLRALRVGRRMKDSRMLKEHTQDTLEYTLPQDALQILARLEADGFPAPQ